MLSFHNIIFVELKRRGHEVFYYSGSKECDFVIRDGFSTKQVIQVCIELHDLSTKEREVSGLMEAMDKFSLAEGLIITENEEYVETLEMQSKTYNIAVVPIWKWLRSFYSELA